MAQSTKALLQAAIDVIGENLIAWEGEENSVQEEHNSLIRRTARFHARATKKLAEKPSDKTADTRKAFRAYQRLHDGLSDMIESGRLREDHIPDDYRWLVEALARIGAMPANN